MNKYTFLATGTFLAACALTCACAVSASVHPELEEYLTSLFVGCFLLGIACLGLYNLEQIKEEHRDNN